MSNSNENNYYNNNENNYNNDENAPTLLAIQDEEHYIRSRGIEPADDENDGPRLCEMEAAARHAEAAAYQDSIHQSIFGTEDEDENDDDDDDDENGGGGMKSNAAKRKQLKLMEGKMLIIQTCAEKDSRRSVPLAPLAKCCDTVYGLAVNSANPRFGNTGEETQKEEKEESMQLDLTQFHPLAVDEFLSIVPFIQNNDTATPTTTTTTTSTTTMVEHMLSEEHIVECTRISHFLQCTTLLPLLSSILEQSIDSQNCLSICHFADQLSLHSLFESALSYVLKTMDNMQNHELWTEFPKDLQCRILTMRNAIQSSIIGRGKKVRVFFSSSEEFLAIFSDNIREQKERLREAKRRQEEVIQERLEREKQRGFLKSRGNPYGGSVRDAEIKIQNQERRIRTLESFYREQKKIFSGMMMEDGGGGGKWCGMETDDHGLAL